MVRVFLVPIKNALSGLGTIFYIDRTLPMVDMSYWVVRVTLMELE